MNKLSTKQVATGSVILGAALLVVIAAGPTSTAVTAIDNGGSTETIVATGTHMQMTEYAENGQRLYSLEVAAWTQYRGAQNTRIELTQPKVRLFDDTRATPWHVSAQRGRATKLGRHPHLTLLDHVQLRQAAPSPKPLNLRSDSLSVDVANDSIIARGNVVLNFGALRTEAPVMTLQKDSTLEFKRGEDLRVVSSLSFAPEAATRSAVASDV